jgi:hypothetical protein
MVPNVAPQRPLTRAERRARRAGTPDARVYGVYITDAGAASWTSRVVFFASSPAAAEQRLREAGIFKRVRQGRGLMADAEVPEDGRTLATAKPDALFLSRHDDDGWTDWIELPASHRHPSHGQAAVHPELRHLPPA